jgi:hypothetical protein
LVRQSSLGTRIKGPDFFDHVIKELNTVGVVLSGLKNIDDFSANGEGSRVLHRIRPEIACHDEG